MTRDLITAPPAARETPYDRGMSADASPDPPLWLSNAHVQLAWGALRRPASVEYRREWVPTADGDALALDHVDAGGGVARPRLLVLHGLEGSSASPMVRGLVAAAQRRGWNATAMNFRSCARDRRGRRIENRRPRLYHSGETGDLELVVSHLAAREPDAPLAAAGGSVGGNVLLKFLGERPDEKRVVAAAALSTPFDLAACARHLESGAGAIYTAFFLRTLRPKAESAARRFPEAAARIDIRRARAARTFFEFDDAATAPLHGFAGAADYYARSSALGFLASIRVPALALSARNDPFLPASVLDDAAAAAGPAVELRIADSGSHLAFPERSRHAVRSWAEDAVLEWLEARIG